MCHLLRLAIISSMANYARHVSGAFLVPKLGDGATWAHQVIKNFEILRLANDAENLAQFYSEDAVLFFNDKANGKNKEFRGRQNIKEMYEKEIIEAGTAYRVDHSKTTVGFYPEHPMIQGEFHVQRPSDLLPLHYRFVCNFQRSGNEGYKIVEEDVVFLGAYN